VADHDARVERLENIATELETAAANCRVAAEHARDSEVPRFAAHCRAAHGHVANAHSQLSEEATDFAYRSRPIITDDK
jgi:hypothetical protein